MAVTYEGENMTIICDKCGETQTCPKDQQFQLFDAGWVLTPNGRKYKNRCYSCLSAKEKRGVNFVKRAFPYIKTTTP